MSQERNSSSILDLFEQNEIRIGELYSLYADRIPSQKNFWSQLAQEEASHAKEIREALSQDASNVIMESKFARGIIDYVTDFVEKEIQRAQKEKLSHTQALMTALRIEQSILEKKCFEIFTPNDQKVKDVLAQLNQETVKHLELLQKEVKKNAPKL